MTLVYLLSMFLLNMITQVLLIFKKILCCYSRTKHIEIRHYFPRDHAQKIDITLEFISIKDQLTDIFTKLLIEDQFVEIRGQLRVISI